MESPKTNVVITLNDWDTIWIFAINIILKKWILKVFPCKGVKRIQTDMHSSALSVTRSEYAMCFRKYCFAHFIYIKGRRKNQSEKTPVFAKKSGRLKFIKKDHIVLFSRSLETRSGWLKKGLGTALKEGAKMILWSKKEISNDLDVEIGKGVVIIQHGSGPRLL